MSIPFTTQVTMLDAVTVDTTSSGFDVSKRQQIAIIFKAASITSGNGIFTIDGSTDGTNWVAGLAMQPATTTTSPGTYVTSVTLSSNTTAGVYVPCGWKEIRVKVDLTTDGAYSAIMHNG